METGLPCIIREVMPGEGTIDLKLISSAGAAAGRGYDGLFRAFEELGRVQKAVSYLKRLAEEG